MTWLDAYKLIKEKHTNNNENIGQLNGDMGDGAQRCGMFATACSILGVKEEEIWFDKALKNLEYEESGLFRRDKDQWNELNDFSRDQHTSLLVGMGFWNQKYRLKRMFKQHIKRYGRYQNKDWASPEHWGMYIRALKYIYLWPVLFIGDFFMLLNSLIICFWKGRDKDNVGDDLNHILSLIQSNFYMPTPVSWLANYIYKKFRPKNYGNEKLKEESSIQGAISWYFRPETGAPPIHEIWRPIIKKFFT